jgi:hypothetical protein
VVRYNKADTRVPDAGWSCQRSMCLGDREGVVDVVAKKLLALLVAGFAIFYLLSQPENAAEAVRGAVGAVMEAFSQIVRFITELFA